VSGRSPLARRALRTFFAVGFLAAGLLAPRAAAGPEGLNAAVKEAVAGIFRRFDADGDGFLRPPEWAPLARTPADVPPDPDRDGRVSLDEFARAFGKMGYLENLLPPTQSLWRGKMLYESGRLEQALASYEGLASRYPACAEAALGTARCLEALGRRHDARTVYLRAATLAGNDPEAWLNLALLELELGDVPAASEHLRQGLAVVARLRAVPGLGTGIGREAERTRYLLECVTRRMEREPRAGSLLRTLEDWKSGNPWWRTGTPEPRPDPVLEALILVRQGWYEQALAVFEGTGSDSWAGTPAWWPALAGASLHGLLGRSEAALRRLELASKLGAPPAALARVRLGLALESGRREEAGAVLKEATLLPLEAREREAIGWELARAGDWKRARPWLEAANRERNVDRNILMMALCGAGAGRLDETRTYLGLLPAPPPEGPAMLRLMAAAASACGRLEQAIAAAEEATQEEPRDGENWACLADCLQRAGQSGRALRELEWGLLLARVDSPGWARMAVAWARAAVADAPRALERAGLAAGFQAGFRRARLSWGQ
jgi:tetratricopeptide (TPR) repeat protein